MPATAALETVASRTLGETTISVQASSDQMTYKVSAKAAGKSVRRTKTYRGESAWSDAQRDANDLIDEVARKEGASGFGHHVML